ncbi:MAG TPA: leishmanolysin-related zinc metalloendopeptidase [Allosphingosinicella sp.]|nr:leishmanolysin-related zinc metalloendopeptidase [Allosphingosinicella sp.]
MRKRPIDSTGYVLEFSKFDFDSEYGQSAYGLGHPRGLDLRPELPLTTHELIGLDLTHIIHTSDVAAARGGNGGGSGGGGGGGGGTTSFPAYTSGPSDSSAGYNITIEFKGSWTQQYYDIFKAAADKLTSLIVGEIPDVTVYGTKGGPKMVDDILITAELGAIDGLYGVLGQAGPTSVRTASSLPATATMKFDIADVNDMGLEAFADVVLHEMAHSLGFGSIWSRLGLVSDGLFTGENALAEYLEMGGSGSGIPVEQDGGSGTAGSHWDEETFVNELMTGYIDNQNYFTEMSAASFADLGYVISPTYGTVVEAGYVFA